jgi:hypothetical protein
LNQEIRFCLGLLLLFSAYSQASSAQESLPWRCVTPRPPLSERTDWYDADGNYVQDTTPKGPKFLREHFREAYSLLVVRSEGGMEHVMDEYDLRWSEPSDSQSRDLRPLPPIESRRFIIPLAGTLAHRRGVIGREVKRGAPTWDISGPIQLEYWPATGKLGFNIGLGIDTGTLFHITDVEADGSFSGRWSDGSMTVLQFDTPLGPVAEHVRGYFCGIVPPR